MARQGRQPQQLSADTKPAKPKPNKKKSSKGKAAKVASDSANLDVYSFTSSTKRPRGDVDPAARASFKDKKNVKGKGKGKARQDEEDDEELSDGGDSDPGSDESETEGFKVRGNDIIDFTGLKPAGLKMGMASDEEGGFGSDDDEDIASDFSDEMSDEGPSKKRASSKVKRLFLSFPCQSTRIYTKTRFSATLTNAEQALGFPVKRDRHGRRRSRFRR